MKFLLASSAIMSLLASCFPESKTCPCFVEGPDGKTIATNIPNCTFDPKTQLDRIDIEERTIRKINMV